MKILISILVFSLFALSFANEEMVICDAELIIPESSENQLNDIVLGVYTQSGVLREEGACSEDAHCFVPVTGLTKFKLRITGSSAVFSPYEYNVDLSETDGVCGQDYKFELKGFGIRSKIIMKGKNKKGPTGVAISLLSQDTQKEVAQTQTIENGEYSFDEVVPGNYIIRAAENDGIQFETQEVKCAISLSQSSDSCNDKRIVISGYSIIGKTLSYEQALSGVQVFLYSGSEDLKADSSITDHPLKGKSKLKVIKKTSSNIRGVYEFSDTPNGQYTLAASIKDTHQKFKIEQSSISVKVDNSVAKVGQSFQIIGFSIVGVVRTQSGKGIEDAVIIIDGVQKATTNDKGSYKLDEMEPGKYIIEVSKDRLIFDPLDITIDAQSKIIPDLVVSNYNLCGQINIKDSEFKVNKRSIVLQDSKTSHQRITKTDEQGKFCFDVKPSSFEIKPDITLEERRAGLRLTPETQSLVLVDAPLEDIIFDQLKISISGKVECFDQSKCSKLKVKLSGDSSLSQNLVNGKFSFGQVRPGDYRVSIDTKDLCFDTKSQDITVGTSDASGIDFKQSGYSIKYELTQDLKIKLGIEGENKPLTKMTLKKHSNEICFPKPADRVILVPDDCMKFSKDHFVYDFTNSKQKPIKFNPTHFEIQGTVKAQSSQDLKAISIFAVQGKEETKLSIESNGDFVHFLKPNSKIELVARASKESQILFYPSTRRIEIQNNCVLNKRHASFEARQGLILSGRIDPVLEGVEVTITSDNGETHTTQTGSDGTYKVGPLYDDQEYTTDVALEGYQFVESEKEKGLYNARILSFLNINVVDEDTNEAIENVLISISGAKSFRQRNSTGKNGQAKFIDLYAGKYFVKPHLKEYKFTPNQLQVQVEEGGKQTQTIKAKKVLFSVSGSLKHLSGRALSDFVIQARSLDSEHIEEASTNSDGSYRLRGLYPGEKYEILLSSDDEKNYSLERAVPKRREILMGKSDVECNFKGFLRTGKFEVLGVVDFENEDSEKYLKEQRYGVVELYDAKKTEEPIAVQDISLSRLFSFSGLPITKKYILKVKASNKESGLKYDSKEIEIDYKNGDQTLDSRFFRIELPESQAKKSQEDTIGQIVGPIILIGILIFFFTRKSKK